ncbi:MAG: energy-coupling factor transporter transmembrane protein EcfT, partial [Gammaproteobacteria bacterium]
MNFFEAQHRARKNTFWFILLFGLAVVGLIFLTNLLILGLLNFSRSDQMAFSPDALQNLYSWQDFALVSAGVCVLIFG